MTTKIEGIFTLCISEVYYKIGMYRTETFKSREAGEAYRRTLVQGTSSWFLGEDIPKLRNF